MYIRHRLPADARVHIDEANLRLKLLACGQDIAETVVAAVTLAEARGLEKIWGIVHPDEWLLLAQIGFHREGALDGYFPDRPGICVARYLSGERARSKHRQREDDIVARAMGKGELPVMAPPPGYQVRPAAAKDADAISRLLTAVFRSYPTPIETAAHITDAMARDVHFFCIEHDGALVSVASADVDGEHLVAEMTDCATQPAYRGRGLMGSLLGAMEAAPRLRELRSLFTLARATSLAMNMAFARLGYAYRGRLINNCHIDGAWEDMNLWVKPLREAYRVQSETHDPSTLRTSA